MIWLLTSLEKIKKKGKIISSKITTLNFEEWNENHIIYNFEKKLFFHIKKKKYNTIIISSFTFLFTSVNETY